MEGKGRGGGGSGNGGGRSGGGGGALVERLPEDLILKVLGKLDLESLCSASPVSRPFNRYVSKSLSYVTTLDLSGFSPDAQTLYRIIRDNQVLQSLTLDCRLLDDSSIQIFSKGHLRELILLKCRLFSHHILNAIGEACPSLRVFTLDIVYRHDFGSSQMWKRKIKGFLEACRCLETFWIKIQGLDIHVEASGIFQSLPKSLKSLLLQPASERQIRSILSKSEGNLTASFTNAGLPQHVQMLHFQLRSLTLVLNNITDELINSFVNSLHLLSDLCLEDQPLEDPALHNDLTNNGLQMLTSLNHLTSLSLSRNELYCSPTFRRVTDIGMFLLAEGCKGLESIRLAGFPKVTDAGYVCILLSCKKLERVEIVSACSLTDLAFHDLARIPCSLVDLKFISCNLLTCKAAASISTCKNLEVLDLSGCKSIGDLGLVSISKLCKLTTLDLGGADINDGGLAALGGGKSPITVLTIRGCKKVTDRGISLLLTGDGVISRTLRTLDLGFMHGITDKSVFTIAEVCRELKSLCLRFCYKITDASLEVLMAMQRMDGKIRCLRMLDIYQCIGLTPKSFQVLTFSKLCWLGAGRTSLSNKCLSGLVELSRKKPWMSLCLHGCEMGCKDGWRHHDQL